MRLLWVLLRRLLGSWGQKRELEVDTKSLELDKPLDVVAPSRPEPWILTMRLGTFISVNEIMRKFQVEQYSDIVNIAFQIMAKLRALVQEFEIKIVASENYGIIWTRDKVSWHHAVKFPFSANITSILHAQNANEDLDQFTQIELAITDQMRSRLEQFAKECGLKDKAELVTKGFTLLAHLAHALEHKLTLYIRKTDNGIELTVEEAGAERFIDFLTYLDNQNTNRPPE